MTLGGYLSSGVRHGLLESGDDEAASKSGCPCADELAAEKRDVGGGHARYPDLKPMKAAKNKAAMKRRDWTGH